VSRYAIAQGCLVLKLNVTGRRGWPDRMYLFHGRTLFIEFKRAGEKLRKLQMYVHGQLSRHQFNVTVVDNYSDGCNVIDSFTKGGSDL
jgi:hypothetical protein